VRSSNVLLGCAGEGCQRETSDRFTTNSRPFGERASHLSRRALRCLAGGSGASLSPPAGHSKGQTNPTPTSGTGERAPESSTGGQATVLPSGTQSSNPSPIRRPVVPFNTAHPMDRKPTPTQTKKNKKNGLKSRHFQFAKLLADGKRRRGRRANLREALRFVEG